MGGEPSRGLANRQVREARSCSVKNGHEPSTAFRESGRAEPHLEKDTLTQNTSVESKLGISLHKLETRHKV